MLKIWNYDAQNAWLKSFGSAEIKRKKITIKDTKDTGARNLEAHHHRNNTFIVFPQNKSVKTWETNSAYIILNHLPTYFCGFVTK